MPMRSTCRIIILTSVLALLLCGAAVAATDDDSLTLGMMSVKTQRLNPLVPQEREFESITALMYESLLTLDDNYRPQACLAESWETSDGSTWFFRLREGVQFHDGTPLTADDVVATVNEILRLATEKKGQFASLQYIIDNVRATDARTFVVKVKRPYYGILFGMTFPVLKAAEVQADNPVGTGPYKLETFRPGDHLYLTVHPNWWQTTPAIQYVNVIFHNTSRDLTSSYEYNRVDSVITRSVTTAQYRATLNSLNIPYRTRQLEVLLMNFKEYPLESVNVRKAIRYAIDVDAIISSCYMGMAKRTDTPMIPGTWMYRDSPSTYEYNPDKAKELLAAEGWADTDGDGILDKVKDGGKKNLRLRIYVYEEQESSVRVEAANMIADMLKAVGINGVVEVKTFTETQTKLSAGSFDLCLVAFQMDTIPDPGFLLMPGNTANYGRYNSKAMGDLFTKLRKTQDPSEYQSLLYQIQDLFAEDCPFLCLYYRTGALLTRKVFTNARDVREPEILRGLEATTK